MPVMFGTPEFVYLSYVGALVFYCKHFDIITKLFLLYETWQRNESLIYMCMFFCYDQVVVLFDLFISNTFVPFANSQMMTS